MFLEINKYEKNVLIYLLIIFSLFTFLILYFAYKKNWFTSTSTYYVYYEEGSGIVKGTTVTIAGMKVGYVNDVILDQNNKILVELKIYSKYFNRIKTDSIAKIVRPYGIGKKIIQISQGKEGILKIGSFIDSKESTELIDLLSGGNIDPYISTIGSSLDALRIVLDKLLSQIDEDKMLDDFSKIDNILNNFNQFTVVMGSSEMQIFLKFASQFFKNIEKTNTSATAENLNKITSNLNLLIEKFDTIELDKLISNLEKLINDLASVSQNMPEFTEKSLKVLEESLWVLKGMQDTWLLRDNIKKAKEKEKKK
jgi:phospholipid/cholesterol/gamma-HCH transport system substrate-binding protein